MIFFSASKVPTALISPMVPMEMRSSSGMPVFSNRRAINTNQPQVVLDQRAPGGLVVLLQAQGQRALLLGREGRGQGDRDPPM